MEPYVRRAYYYETDQMSIVHHSNYIRWMEEARFDYMKQLGVNYTEIEAKGIIMPVVSVDCKYISSAHYDEPVYIYVKATLFNGIRACYSYEMKTEDGTLVATGTSSHCFLDTATRRPVNLKRRLPEFFEKCEKITEE